MEWIYLCWSICFLHSVREIWTYHSHFRGLLSYYTMFLRDSPGSVVMAEDWAWLSECAITLYLFLGMEAFAWGWHWYRWPHRPRLFRIYWNVLHQIPKIRFRDDTQWNGLLFPRLLLQFSLGTSSARAYQRSSNESTIQVLFSTRYVMMRVARITIDSYGQTSLLRKRVVCSVKLNGIVG